MQNVGKVGKERTSLDMQMVNSFKHAKYKYLTRQVLLGVPVGLQKKNMLTL